MLILYTLSIIVHLGRNSKFGFGLHLCGAEMISIGEDVYFGKDCALTAFNSKKASKHLTINIGDHCMFGNDNHITAACGIMIGDGFRSGKGVLISDNSHGDPSSIEQRKMKPNDRPLYCKGPIMIGQNVWVGEKAAILSGVSIGDGAIIGVNTVVTHNVPSYSIAVDCPAKIL